MTAEYRFPSALEGWQHSISGSTHLLHMTRDEAWLAEDSVDRESFSEWESSGNGPSHNALDRQVSGVSCRSSSRPKEMTGEPVVCRGADTSRYKKVAH